METYFEVTTCVKKAHYVELYKLALPRRMLSVVICGVLGVWLLVEELLQSGVNFGLFGIGVLIIAVWLYRRPWSLATTAMAQDKAFTDSEQRIVNIKFGQEICVSSSNSNMTLPYDKLMKVRVTASTVFLYDVRNVAIIVDKDGFTQGEFQEFLPFLQEKCPKLRFSK